MPDPAAAPGPENPGLSLVNGRVAVNQTLPKLLKAAGLSTPERAAAERALESGAFDTGRMRSGDRYVVAHSSDGALAYLLYYANRTSRYRLERSTSGFTAALETVPVLKRTVGISGTVDDSLWASMHAAGLSDDVIFRFVDIFAWQVDFLTEPRHGDRFRLVWEQTIAEGKALPNGRILAAGYQGKEAGRHFATLFHDAAGRDAYYDLEGKSLQKAFLRAPLQYKRISSHFTYHRVHPITGVVRPHLGIDYAAPIGTPVDAIGDGEVVFAAVKGGNGRLIRVRHNATYESYYLHLSHFAKGIHPGAHVRQGQVIGYVGQSGEATGPHLDFRMYVDGTPRDFLKLKLPSTDSVPKESLDAFNEQKRQVLSLLGSVSNGSELAQAVVSPADSLTQNR